MKNLVTAVLFALMSATPGLAAAGPTLRVLLYGDAGTGEKPQFDVARAMTARHSVAPFGFALSLGDNWYTHEKDALPRIFEAPYSALISRGLVFYQTLGNHDHQDGRREIELEYAKGHPSFGLPAPSYVVTRPELKLIVLDLARADSQINLPPEKIRWLETELCTKSPEPWKALALHYHLWSTGPRGDHPELQKLLLPLLARCPVDFVLSGHEHHAELFEPMPGTWAVISGNGGAATRPQRSPSTQKSLFYTLEKGFAELELSRTEARIAFYDDSDQGPKLRFSKLRTKK